MFSLAGIPPLSGFWPKIQLFGESLKAEQYALLGAIIFASFVTLYVIAKMWSEVFWKDSPKRLTEDIDRFAPLRLSKSSFDWPNSGFILYVFIHRFKCWRNLQFGRKNGKRINESKSIHRCGIKWSF